MRAADREALWRRLAAGGVVAGPEPPAAAPGTPWFTRVALGFAAWLGALFLIGFVGAGLGFVLESGVASLVVGLGTWAGAAALLRMPDPTEFLAQAGLAVSFTGQCLFFYGVHQTFDPGTTGMLLWVAAAEVLAIRLVDQPVHRLGCTLAGVLAASLALGRLQLAGLAPGLLALGVILAWWDEFASPERGQRLRPIGYGLALAALAVNGALYLPHLGAGLGLYRGGWLAGGQLPWLGPLLQGAALVALVALLLRREGLAPGSPQGLRALAGALVLVAAAWQAPGLTIGLLLLLLGFAGGNRLLLGLGLFGLVAYLSGYYYALQLSLLAKAGILAGCGLLLLAARLLVHRRAACPVKEAGHA